MFACPSFPPSYIDSVVKGCIGLGLLVMIIDFFKMMTYIEFHRFLKIFIDFCRVCTCIDDFINF